MKTSSHTSSAAVIWSSTCGLQEKRLQPQSRPLHWHIWKQRTDARYRRRNPPFILIDKLPKTTIYIKKTKPRLLVALNCFQSEIYKCIIWIVWSSEGCNVFKIQLCSEDAHFCQWIVMRNDEMMKWTLNFSTFLHFTDIWSVENRPKWLYASRWNFPPPYKLIGITPPIFSAGKTSYRQEYTRHISTQVQENVSLLQD